MEIKSYFSVNKGSLMGTFDLCVPKWGDLTIKGMKVFQKDGARWVSFPSEKVEKDGKTEYYPRLFFPKKETMEAFRDAVLKAVDKYALENAQKPPPKKEAPQYEDLPF